MSVPAELRMIFFFVLSHLMAVMSFIGYLISLNVWAAHTTRRTAVTHYGSWRIQSNDYAMWKSTRLASSKSPDAHVNRLSCQRNVNYFLIISHAHFIDDNIRSCYLLRCLQPLAIALLRFSVDALAWKSDKSLASVASCSPRWRLESQKELHNPWFIDTKATVRPKFGFVGCANRSPVWGEQMGYSL